MAAILKETEVAGERFMTLGAVLLVASKSEPGTWHRLDGQTCDCKGFQYRGHCRHIAAALELEAQATTAVTIEITTEQGGGWRVIWGGHWHGGVHHHREDAEAHAQELREAPDWDYADWLERHGYGAPVPPVPTGRPALHLIEGGAR